MNSMQDIRNIINKANCIENILEIEDKNELDNLYDLKNRFKGGYRRFTRFNESYLQK